MVHLRAVFLFRAYVCFGTSLQLQRQVCVITEVVLREREAKRLVPFDRTTGHTADQLHFRVVPEAEVAHRLGIVRVGFFVGVVEYPSVNKGMVLLDDLYLLPSGRHTEFEFTVTSTCNQGAVAVKHRLSVNFERGTDYRNGRVFVEDKSVYHNGRIVSKVDV